jgi:oxygen-independent coproporphyrinogen-3 oxidase
MTALGLYVHIPFCPQHCPYCAFAVLTGHTDLYDRYVDAVCTEIRCWRHLAPKGPLSTVFFGGGTPSMLEPGQVQRILDTAVATLGLLSDAEITLEANPSTADAARFAGFKDSGCNRLSLGVQAFNNADLKTLGRRHTAADAEYAYAMAREAGFTNVNLDVIFSIPGAPCAHWEYTLQRLIALRPEHVSTYSLTIEEGTRFARRSQQGRLQPVSEEEDAWAYTRAMEALTAAGYEQYEVSNFARPGYRSRHNWGYWHAAEYLGVGLSAHSFLDGQRRWNTRHVRQYIAHLEAGETPCAGEEVLDAATARQEQVWLQLRTCEGVVLETAELTLLQQRPKFQGLLETGLLQLEARRLCLTQRGLLLADAIGLEVLDMLENSGYSPVREDLCGVA